MQRTPTLLSVLIGALVTLGAASAQAAEPTVWTTKINPLTHNGSSGTIKFNDWGYKGPRGVGANDFQVGPGFDHAPYRLGQVQNVLSVAPDWKTGDPAYHVIGDSLISYTTTTASPGFTINTSLANLALMTNYTTLGSVGVAAYRNASMDGQTNFFLMGYTSPPGQKFNNMKIDRAGNYFVAKADMQWKYYGEFHYHDTTGKNADQVVKTNIGFQPYPISDAKGWCGSTLIANPNGTERMAGQVTFDFALAPKIAGIAHPVQYVPNFVMRSYGDYEIDVRHATGIRQQYKGSAVGNNTNPATHVDGMGAQLDENYRNRVSFLGGGVVPAGAWVLNDGTPEVKVVPFGTRGATWHVNTFAGFAFLLRADANRTLVYVNPEGHSDYVETDPAVYSSLGQ
mgnify:CR=1 FL=1